VSDLVEVVSTVEPTISTVATPPVHPSSDDVLRATAPGMMAVGYAVEANKTMAGKIRRPVLFGENGQASVAYEIDAFHDAQGIVVEVEAGRGAMSNAIYRDIVRTSLIVDAEYLALLVPSEYHYKSGGKGYVVQAYTNTRAQLDAIYASDRLKLPFRGVLLVGY
jgi:hypothetical protein